MLRQQGHSGSVIEVRWLVWRLPGPGPTGGGYAASADSAYYASGGDRL